MIVSEGIAQGRYTVTILWRLEPGLSALQSQRSDQSAAITHFMGVPAGIFSVVDNILGGRTFEIYGMGLTKVLKAKTAKSVNILTDSQSLRSF